MVAWLLLQIADVILEPLGVPRWVMISLITAVPGFPVAIMLAWHYEPGDRGLERDTVVDAAARPVVHGLRRYADVAIIGVLRATVAALLVRQSDFGNPLERWRRLQPGKAFWLAVQERYAEAAQQLDGCDPGSLEGHPGYSQLMAERKRRVDKADAEMMQLEASAEGSVLQLR